MGWKTIIENEDGLKIIVLLLRKNPVRFTDLLNEFNNLGGNSLANKSYFINRKLNPLLDRGLILKKENNSILGGRKSKYYEINLEGIKSFILNNYFPNYMKDLAKIIILDKDFHETILDLLNNLKLPPKEFNKNGGIKSGEIKVKSLDEFFQKIFEEYLKFKLYLTLNNDNNNNNFEII